MSAYVIADLDVKDTEEFRKYARRVPETIARYGGRYLVRGGKVETVEGSWNPRLLVVLEFPSWEAARKWYDSEEYRPLLAMRQRSALTNGVLVEGVAPS